MLLVAFNFDPRLKLEGEKSGRFCLERLEERKRWQRNKHTL